jgi:ketosteroid isomerase-like protein
MPTGKGTSPRILVIILVAMLFLTLARTLAQNTGVRAEDDPAAVVAVEKLEHELCDLIVRGEWQKYESNLADDYVRVLPGRVQNKAEALEEFRTSQMRTIAMIPEVMRTRIYGDTAVVIIDLSTRDRAPDGRVIEQRGRATKVFVRRNGRWYLAQLSGSPSS